MLRSLAQVVFKNRNHCIVKSVRYTSGYKAAVLKEFDSPLLIETLSPKKKLGSDEVRIKTEACGVNVSDILVCKGEHEYKPKLPFVPGYELSGTVMQVGSKVKAFKVGDRVVSINRGRNGGFAEECIAPMQDIWKIPSRLSFDEAAAMVDSYGIAFLALGRRALLKKNDVVVVTAAAGGIGLAAVDIAANVYQAKVIGICGSEHKAERVREKGAWAALKYNKSDVLDAVNEVSNGVGAKVIFDAVGGSTFEEVLDCVAHEGKVIVAGFASQQVPTIATNVLLPKSFALIGVSMRHYRQNAYELYRETIEEIMTLAEEKYIEANIAARFKLEEVNDAFHHIHERKSTDVEEIFSSASGLVLPVGRNDLGDNMIKVCDIS